MDDMRRVLSMKPGTVVVDKYGGAAFTVEEVAALVVPMIGTDGKDEVDRFCERFEVKEDRRSMSKVYIGIDNGLSGALCAIGEGVLDLFVMPVLSSGKRKRVDVESLAKLLDGYESPELCVVYESPAGSKSVLAAVSMADSFARVESVLIIKKVRRIPITSTKWQRSFWTKPKMAVGQVFDTKAAALKVARELWPNETWLASARCKVPHNGLVDAALIAEYARRAGL